MNHPDELQQDAPASAAAVPAPTSKLAWPLLIAITFLTQIGMTLGFPALSCIMRQHVPWSPLPLGVSPRPARGDERDGGAGFDAHRARQQVAAAELGHRRQAGTFFG